MKMTPEAIVHEAAVRIGLATNHCVVQNVCNRMNEELVTEEWQLEFIDSLQWEKLGAPIGLVAAVRSVLSSQQQEEAPIPQPIPQLPANIIASRTCCR
jgi:hypothetical protein